MGFFHASRQIVSSHKLDLSPHVAVKSYILKVNHLLILWDVDVRLIAPVEIQWMYGLVSSVMS